MKNRKAGVLVVLLQVLVASCEPQPGFGGGAGGATDVVTDDTQSITPGQDAATHDTGRVQTDAHDDAQSGTLGEDAATGDAGQGSGDGADGECTSCTDALDVADSTGCQDDDACNDWDPCTIDLCKANGSCAHVSDNSCADAGSDGSDASDSGALDACLPECAGKCGGPDSCGGACADTCDKDTETCDPSTWTCKAVGCKSDSECGDGNPCTMEFCIAGSCQQGPSPDGTTCPGGKVCKAGVCNCTPTCTFGTCGMSDGCAGVCGCPSGAYCIEGLCTNSCPVGKSCSPPLKTCYAKGTYQELGNQCGCLADPTSKASDGTFCDMANAGKDACVNGVCTACVPPYMLEDGQYFSGTTLNYMNIGIGIDTAGNNIRGTCVDLPPPADLCSTAKVDSNLYVNVVTEATTLDSALQIDAAAHYGGVGLYDAKAKFSKSQSSSMRTDSAFLVLSMEVNWSTGGQLSSVALKPDKLELAKKDPVGFMLGCGDQYVDSVVSGGYFRIVYHFKGMSSSAKKDLSTSFSGKSVNWKVDASFASTVQETAAKYETELWLFKSGASPSKLALTLPELLAQAKCFTDPAATGCSPGDLLTCTNAKAVSMHTTPYQATVGWPAGLALPTTGKQRKIRDATVALATKVNVALNDVTFRLEHQADKLKALPECAGEHKKLTQHQTVLASWLAKAETRIEACSKVYLCGASPACLQDLPPIPSLDLPLMDKALVQTCGPVCSAKQGATYEIDAFGYCTRCDFDLGKSPDWFGFNGIKNGPGPVKFDSAICKYMRPGASAHLGWCGTMSQAVSKGIGMYGLWLQAVSGANTGACSGGSYNQSQCNGYFDGWQGQPNPWNYKLTNELEVGTTGQVGADLYLLSCTGYDAHCWATGMKVMVCDGDSNAACAMACP